MKFKNKWILQWLIFLFCQYSFAADQMAFKKIVTCSAHQCPMLPDLLNPNEKLVDQVIVFETSYDKFFSRKYKSFTSNDNGGWQHITVNEVAFVKTHPIVGFGGSFTDSASMLYKHMQPLLQKALIDSYFSNKGLAYSLARVPIASTDFSCRTLVRKGNQEIPLPSLTNCINVFSCYSYADQRDKSLKNFTLQPEDIEYKIPMIHDAMKTVNNASHNMLRLFASPWSAPAWMKTNNRMVYGYLDARYHQIWANYIIKFLRAYLRYQIRFWGLTVQNEPVEGGLIKDTQTWQTMYFTQVQEADFVKKLFGTHAEKVR